MVRKDQTRNLEIPGSMLRIAPEWQVETRHGRACPGHPRLASATKKDVDARHKAGHDEKL
jgi:hypothetical protein